MDTDIKNILIIYNDLFTKALDLAEMMSKKKGRLLISKLFIFRAIKALLQRAQLTEEIENQIYSVLNQLEPLPKGKEKNEWHLCWKNGYRPQLPSHRGLVYFRFWKKQIQSLGVSKTKFLRFLWFHWKKLVLKKQISSIHESKMTDQAAGHNHKNLLYKCLLVWRREAKAAARVKNPSTCSRLGKKKDLFCQKHFGFGNT